MIAVGADLVPVIGLEVHAQLLTASKMFCGCDARYAQAVPNSRVCPVCGGFPGSLPVINRKAVDYTIKTALALNCRISPYSKFDRKNYPYPDIPKGFQISQYDVPIGTGGWLDFQVDNRQARCGIVRVHLEEDTGKTLHTFVDGRSVSLVDYNRSGVALMEIVSQPELHSPDEAKEYFSALRHVLMYLGVCDGKLQEGSMRADVNVSLRAPDGALGTKVEIKNLNSFRAVYRALEHEIERQRDVLAAGGTITQETRGWSERDEVTISQRTKEYAQDYRYFPEPDLPPLVISAAHIAGARDMIPELPLARSERFQREYGVGQHMAGVLTEDRALADFFEAAVNAAPAVPPNKIGNWMTGEVLRLLNEAGITVDQSILEPAGVAALVTMIEYGEISGAAGKLVLQEMFEMGMSPDVIVEQRDLRQLADTGELEGLVVDALERNPQLVNAYRRGKLNAIQALVGQVMKASKGKANPATVKALLENRLRE